MCPFYNKRIKCRGPKKEKDTLRALEREENSSALGHPAGDAQGVNEKGAGGHHLLWVFVCLFVLS